MKAATQKRLTALFAVAAAGAAITFLAFGGIEDNLVYYWAPADVLEKSDQIQGVTIRLGGMVEPDSLKWDEKALVLRFNMGGGDSATGDNSKTIPVISKGAPPQMFREGIGCVVEGTWDGSVFTSDRLMVKHSNEYHPPEEGEDPKEMYKTLVGDEPPAGMGKKMGKMGGMGEAPAFVPPSFATTKEKTNEEAPEAVKEEADTQKEEAQ